MRHICFFLLLLTACPNDDIPNDDESSSGTTHEPVVPDFTSGDGASVTSADPPTTSNGDPNTTTGDESTDGFESSTGDDGTTTTGGDEGVDTGFECFPLDEILQDSEALNAKCELHPWKRKDECNPNPSMPSCQEMIEILVEHEGCELTICDYAMCADALALAECGVRPKECDPLMVCLNMPSPASELQKMFENFLRIFKAAAPV